MPSQSTAPLPNQLVVPPYVPYRSFRNFIDSLKQGIPARIDRSVMSSMSGALQSQLTTTLRYLLLISPAGQPSSFLPKLVNSEGPERAKVMREIVTHCYPFLFQDFDLRNATPRMVEEQFAEQGASGGTLDKCMLFFLAAAKEAEIEVSPHLKNQRGARSPRTRAISRTPRIPVGYDDSAGAANAVENGDLTWSQMLLSKFPSFDPAWPDEVKAKWFDGFHRLMRMKEGDKE
jgi:hypothetical protein